MLNIVLEEAGEETNSLVRFSPIFNATRVFFFQRVYILVDGRVGDTARRRNLCEKLLSLAFSWPVFQASYCLRFGDRQGDLHGKVSLGCSRWFVQLF